MPGLTRRRFLQCLLGAACAPLVLRYPASADETVYLHSVTTEIWSNALYAESNRHPLFRDGVVGQWSDTIWMTYPSDVSEVPTQARKVRQCGPRQRRRFPIAA